jgi:hypothetical protein
VSFSIGSFPRPFLITSYRSLSISNTSAMFSCTSNLLLEVQGITAGVAGLRSLNSGMASVRFSVREKVPIRRSDSKVMNRASKGALVI